MCLSRGTSQTERGWVRLWHLPECSPQEVQTQILALQKRNQSLTSFASVWLVSSVRFSDVLCRLVTLSWWLPFSCQLTSTLDQSPGSLSDGRRWRDSFCLLCVIKGTHLRAPFVGVQRPVPPSRSPLCFLLFQSSSFMSEPPRLCEITRSLRLAGQSQ